MSEQKIVWRNNNMVSFWATSVRSTMPRQRRSAEKKLLGYQVFTSCFTRSGNPHSLPGLPKNAERKLENLGTRKTWKMEQRNRQEKKIHSCLDKWHLKSLIEI